MYRQISAPSVRLCGTPGCTLPDWHVGCHSTERRLPPRLAQQHTPRPPHQPPRRSPRLSPRFRWDDFHIDIQASVLLNISTDPRELLIHLVRLVCHIRPFRDAIQHALSIHAGLRDMLSDGWKACLTKFDREMGDLSCSWCQACRLDALNEALDERVEFELRLQWDAPLRRCRWIVSLRWSVNARPRGSLCIASCSWTLTPRFHLGLQHPGTHSKRPLHVVAGQEWTASPQQMHRHHACVPHFPFSDLDRMRIGSTSQGFLRLTVSRRTLIVWVPPRETRLAMHLVSALASP